MGRPVALSGLLAQELERRVLWVPVCLALGILGYFQLAREPGAVMIWGSAALCAALMAALRFSPYGLRPVVWALALVAAGASLAGYRTQSVAAPVLDWRYYGPVEGRVIGLDRSASGALRVTLDQVVLGRMAPARTPHKVRVSIYGPDEDRRPAPGARIMMTAHLSPPNGPAEPGGFDFQRHAWFQELGGVGYTRTPVLLALPAPPGMSLFSLRIALSERVQNVLPGARGAFGAALMSGDRSGLPPDVLQALRDTNLAHLLAISGLHMGLLAGFVYGALRLGLVLLPGFGQNTMASKLAAAGAWLAAAGYFGLSGGSIATERAFIMASVALGAIILGRRAVSLRAVAIAATLLLIRRPEMLTGPGFQMSFAATTALVVVFTGLSKRNAKRPPTSKVRRALSGAVISSAVAGLATWPIAAAHFNQMAHYGLIANLLSVPLMGAMIMPLAVVAVLLMPLGWDAPVLHVMGWGLEWILNVAQTVQSWPGAVRVFPSPPSWAFALLCFGLLALALMVTRLRWAALVPVAVAMAAWWGVQRPDVLIAGDGGLVGVMTEQGRALSKAKGAGFVAGIWLENDGDATWQDAAAGRWPDTTPVRALHGKRGLRGFDGCSAAQIVVFSEDWEQSAECVVFDRSRLAQTGSVAIYWTASGPPIIQTARGVAGVRLWNDANLRRARFGW